MELLKKYPEAKNKTCPYCGAKPGENCKVKNSSYRNGLTTVDDFGRPLVHRKRIG